MKRIQPPLEDRLEPPYISTDRNAHASYIALTDHPIMRTDEVHPCVILDLDEKGDVVGVEIFGDEFIDLMERVVGERQWRVDGRASEAY